MIYGSFLNISFIHLFFMVFMVNFKMEKIDWIKLDRQNKTDKYDYAFCFKSRISSKYEFQLIVNYSYY